MKTVADNSIRFVELRQSIMFADKVEDIGFTVEEWRDTHNRAVLSSAAVDPVVAVRRRGKKIGGVMVRLRGRRWTIDYKTNGKRYRRTIPAASEREALEIAEKKNREILRKEDSRPMLNPNNVAPQNKSEPVQDSPKIEIRTVRVVPEFIESWLRTGAITSATKVLEGIPDDARLVACGMCSGFVEMTFAGTNWAEGDRGCFIPVFRFYEPPEGTAAFIERMEKEAAEGSEK